VIGKVSQLVEGLRKNNILFFELEERGTRDEGYFDTVGIVRKFLRETVKLEVLNGSIDCEARLGRKRGKWTWT
jgi:hypothetical protein